MGAMFCLFLRPKGDGCPRLFLRQNISVQMGIFCLFQGVLQNLNG
jgi:hypothetical protein